MGSGAREAELVQQAKAMNLRNAIFAGEHKVREIPHWLARADVCISSLLPEPYLEKILSVKIFEYLACGKPVVGAHSGESARVLMESGGGLVVPPSDAQAMAGAIRALYRDPDLRVRGIDLVRLGLDGVWRGHHCGPSGELVGTVAVEQLQPSLVRQRSTAVQFVWGDPVKLAASTVATAEERRSVTKTA